MPVETCSLLAVTSAARAVIPWLQRLWPWVGMSCPGQGAQTPYITAAALPHSPSNSSGSEGGVAAPHSFLPRSITIPWSLSGHPDNSQPLLLTHHPSRNFIHPKRAALDSETPTLFPSLHLYISQLIAWVPCPVRRGLRLRLSVCDIFSPHRMLLELVKTCIFPLNGLHTLKSSS